MAERAGFEPAWRLWAPHPISSRRRYDRFGTSPKIVDYRGVFYDFPLFNSGGTKETVFVVSE